jgi:hypothetical protein
MELSLNLTTLLPALRAISSITPGTDEGTWRLKFSTGRFQATRITPAALVNFLKGLGAEVLSEERDEVTIRLPTEQTLEAFIEERRDNLLRLYKPRLLTEEEIEDLIASLPRVLSPIREIGEHARKEIQKRLREQLREIEITPLGLPDLKDAIIMRFERARVEPGETVGLTVAEALSALTQAALNAFHVTGTRTNIAAGIEMLQDLLAARPERKIDQSSIHFWDKDLTFEQDFAKRAELVEITVGGKKLGPNSRIEGLVLDYTVDSPENFEPVWWVTLYPQLTGKELPRSSSVVLLELNKSRMYNHNITMRDVVEAIEGYNTPNIVTVVASSMEEARIFVYPDEKLVNAPLKKNKIEVTQDIAATFLNEIFLPQLEKIRVKGVPGIQALTTISAATWSIVQDEIKITSPEKRRPQHTWILSLSRFVIAREGVTPQKLATLLSLLGYEILQEEDYSLVVVAPNEEKPSVYVGRRIDEAEKIVEARRKERSSIQKDRQRARLAGEALPEYPAEVQDISYEIVRASRYYYSVSQGSNLTALYARPDIDTYRTTTNNLHTTLRLHGIEAARNLLIHEFIYILESASLELDPRHIILLADFMTNRGVLVPVSFWGMIKSNPGPLTVAAFGKAVNVFQTGAVFGQSEPVRTTASAMYLGQRAKFGTGYMDLRIDEDKIKAFEEKQQLLDAADLETAIQQLDKISFGAVEETEVADPLAGLAALSIQQPAKQTTQRGTGTIPPPVELIRTTPVVSTLAEKAITGIQVTGALPTPETVITVTQEPAPTVKRALPKPATRTRPSLLRRPISMAAPQEIPKAQLPPPS